MIVETKEALLAIREGMQSPDGDTKTKNERLFSFIRSTGLRPLRLGDGTEALGTAMDDGTFFVLQTKEGSYLPIDPTRQMPEWVARRLDGETGQGITLSNPVPMLEAYRAMIGLPSPRLQSGELCDMECDTLDAAMEAVSGGGALRF